MGRENVISQNTKLLLALLALQFSFAGFHIVSRVALNIGVSKVVYPVYRNIIALILLGPFAYFLEPRALSKDRPHFLQHNCDDVQIFPLFWPQEGKTTPYFLFAGSVLSSCAVRAPVLKKYPAKLTLTSFTCLFGLIQFLVIAVFVETDTDRWKILYATWCIPKGVLVFAAIFQPVHTSSRRHGYLHFRGTALLWKFYGAKRRRKEWEVQQKEETITKRLPEARAATEDGRSHVASDQP